MEKIKNNVLALVGMTGCGKSSVGRLLAKKLDARLVDVDDEIVARHGAIKEIFEAQGEEAFRKIERDTLAEIVTEAGGELIILSCGGGLVTYEPSRELLRETATVVWLRRSADSVAADPNVLLRPPINGDIANYKRLLKLRYPIYHEVSDYSFYNAFPQRTAANIIKKLFSE